MNKTLLLILLLGASFASEEASKPLNDAQQAVAKAYDSNLVKAQKSYEAYLKELSVAQGAVQKDLEKIKADLNDTKKFTKLSIAERAKAIEEIDGKIAELKKGSLGEMVVAKSGGDMLGENSEDLAKAVIGKWDGDIGPLVKGIWTFNKGGVGDFKGYDSNAKMPFNESFSWKVEEGKVKVDIANKHSYFCYLTVAGDELSGSAWISQNVSAKRITKK